MAERNQGGAPHLQNLAQVTDALGASLQNLVDNLPEGGAREIPVPRGFMGQFQLLVNQLFNRAAETTHVGTMMWLGSGRGVGVTTGVTHFARFLTGHLKQRVLLVDANYQNPSLHKLFVLPDKPGLSEYLAGVATAQDTVRKIAASPGLYVMTAGDPAHLPRTLLSLKGRVRESLDDLVRHFDLVLLDGAPVTMSPESFNLAGKVDGVLLMARAERTRKEVLKAARDQLRQAGANVLGGVLNRRTFHIPAWLYRRIG